MIEWILNNEEDRTIVSQAEGSIQSKVWRLITNNIYGDYKQFLITNIKCKLRNGEQESIMDNTASAHKKV